MIFEGLLQGTNLSNVTNFHLTRINVPSTSFTSGQFGQKLGLELVLKLCTVGSDILVGLDPVRLG